MNIHIVKVYIFSLIDILFGINLFNFPLLILDKYD